MKIDHLKKYVLSLLFSIFILFSFLFDYTNGKEIYMNFYDFFKTMIKFVPTVFILIGLFEVWVDDKVIRKHLGNNSGIISYIWVILLSGTTIGGLYTAFPVAAALYNKGASLRVIFTYVGAAAVCRIPMTLFEATYVGLKFTLIRILTSMPFIILSSILLEKYIKKQKNELSNI